MGLKNLFFKSAVVNASTAALNLLGTVLIVRWFGAGVYADYLVDLAYLSLMMICLEIVPSNYSVFRVQDNPNQIRSLAALAVVTSFALSVIALVSGYIVGLFHARSIWIVLYAALMATKRYLDIRLQSTGQLQVYLGIELRGAAIRIILMAIFLWLMVPPVDAVWASLAFSTFMTQFVWFVLNKAECVLFTSIFNKAVWIPLIEERRAYIPYYLGIVFKRIRDNLVPILASVFFIDRNALGAFFLAYRGLSFTLGQIRIIEGLLSHRQTLKNVMNMPIMHQTFVAFLGQGLCIVASIFIIVSSGINNYNFVTLFILSFIVWFYVFSLFERSKAYSSYDANIVNISLISYSIVALVLTNYFIIVNIRTEIVYSLALVCAEAASLLTIHLLKRHRRNKCEKYC